MVARIGANQMSMKLSQKVLNYIGGIVLKSIKDYQPKKIIEFHEKIRFHPDLDWGEKVFLAEIHEISKTGKCPFSSRTLCKFFGVSHQTILNWVKHLEEINLIEVGIDYKNTECRQFIKSKDIV